MALECFKNIFYIDGSSYNFQMSIQQVGSQFHSFSNMLPHSLTTNRFNNTLRRKLESIERVFALGFAIQLNLSSRKLVLNAYPFD
jgi:hypothetical protein